MAPIQRLCAQLRAGDALVTDNASARVIKSMAESGVFKLGGVLVGTHAYIVLANVLGVRWDHAATRTRDIDIAGDRRFDESEISVAVPQINADIPSALESLKMGFFPVPRLDHQSTIHLVYDTGECSAGRCPYPDEKPANGTRLNFTLQGGRATAAVSRLPDRRHDTGCRH